jgi:hypothetical protein
MPPAVHALRPAPQPIQAFTTLARKFQILSADEAAGRCLSVSLEFALAAERQLGVDPQLVKWRVKDDPAYVDHWAVLLDSDNVIDLTRVQVDGSTKMICPIGDYPANYVNRRVYPTSLLGPAYLSRRAPGAARLSNTFLWSCGTRLLRHDLAAALRGRDLRGARAALDEFATFLTCFAISSLTRTLETRASRLLGRLSRHAEPSARTAFGDLSEFEPAEASGFGALVALRQLPQGTARQRAASQTSHTRAKYKA